MADETTPDPGFSNVDRKRAIDRVFGNPKRVAVLEKLLDRLSDSDILEDTEEAPTDGDPNGGEVNVVPPPPPPGPAGFSS